MLIVSQYATKAKHEMQYYKPYADSQETLLFLGPRGGLFPSDLGQNMDRY